ncbi:DoxX family protein [Chitinophaga japonensis]|uniref:DoxX-like protein n=1 Tax=Chitinophaga japonensis TaxID=104662 RepID=A0A562T644_CHIJA|nr:DoxX family protein [Chitinophaga japonensis]TWI88995.1 DoxX-like protein [Chitinophaga japonensis]
MKKVKIIYWIFTILLAAGMAFSGITNLFPSPEAFAVFEHLGYPDYLTYLLGAAKVLGVIAILTPGFPRLKEWAYAGFVIDFTGATYSLIAVGDPPAAWGVMIIPFVLVAVSYIYYHKKRKLEQA